MRSTREGLLPQTGRAEICIDEAFDVRTHAQTEGHVSLDERRAIHGDDSTHAHDVAGGATRSRTRPTRNGSDGYDDLAARSSRLHRSNGLRRLAQRVSRTDDRSDLARLDHVPEREQIVRRTMLNATSESYGRGY
jgi:hypothetical protein